MDLQPGMRLADGQYVVERPLGAGGMAIVYLVTRTEDGAPLALKVLNSPSPSQQGRLIREGRAQKTLRHEHIVAVTDVLKVGGLPALLMEYIDGPSLERVIPRVRLTLDQVDALFRGVLAGMAAAHVGGFVHRDLKPGNVMLALDEGRVVAKVADFGLVKAEDANHTVAETRTGAMMGTPAYMAPEQVRDAKDVDSRADVFA
ncbi:MAG: serine/threonine protein kinase, partial [Proteobacteria bacterium]|nr:serine/threonine protein kinase [Pseudomonadota bacterium]